MRRPTDLLRAEHALTAQASVVLASMAGYVRAGAPFPAADCALLLRFLREFVLAVHLRKEDDLLCPAVAMRGDDRAAELVGEVLRLHEQVAELLLSLVLFWEPTDELSPAERAGFADTADAVVQRLQRMQELEEQQLFPLCDAAVPADDQLDWLAQFAQLELRRGDVASWRQRLAPLLGRWSH